MRHGLLFLAVLLLAKPVLAQQGDGVDPATRTALTTTREAVWRAFFEGDSTTLMRLLPARMVAMGRSRAGIIEDAIAYRRSGGTFLGMEFTEDQFYVHGETAVVWSHYVARLIDASGKRVDRKGRAIELFVKSAGRWVNPHWHLDDGP